MTPEKRIAEIEAIINQTVQPMVAARLGALLTYLKGDEKAEFKLKDGVFINLHADDGHVIARAWFGPSGYLLSDFAARKLWAIAMKISRERWVLSPDKLPAKKITQCCERDHNHDGNCDRHPSDYNLTPEELRDGRIIE